MAEQSTIEKLDYIYRYIDTGQGDKDTALGYLQEVADEIDQGLTCGGGRTIPLKS